MSINTKQYQKTLPQNITAHTIRQWWRGGYSPTPTDLSKENITTTAPWLAIKLLWEGGNTGWIATLKIAPSPLSQDNNITYNTI